MGNDEDLQTKPVDSLNLMLSNQIKATLMDDDGGENEGEEEDEDDEVQAGTDAEANDGEQADNTPDGNQTGQTHSLTQVKSGKAHHAYKKK